MAVIVELSLSPDRFELGRILTVATGATVILETVVPLGDRSVPFVRHLGGNQSTEQFEPPVRNSSVVDDLRTISAHGDETLYALDWNVSADSFFQGVLSMGGQVLEATGTTESWGFELRFPSHRKLSEFQTHCTETDIPIEVERIYNPTRPDAGPWYGLTTPQRTTLCRAAEAGYYAIPRQTSTADLAAELDISDQAVTERLRRAIDTLTANTLLVSDSER